MSAVLKNGKEISRNALIAMMAAILAPDYPGSTIITDSVTSDELTVFLEKELGLKHLRYMRGYKNVIDECIRQNKAGTVSPLAIETSGHGALSENYYLDDGAYLAVKLLIAAAKAKAEAEARAKAEADSLAAVHAAELAKLKAEAEKVKAEADRAKAEAEALARTKAEAEARAKAEAEALAKAKAEAEARAKAEAEARAKAEAEARARAKAEQKAREEAAFVAGFSDTAYFETGKDMPIFGQLNEASWDNLNDIMDRHPEIMVTVTGYTDNVGNDVANMNLSKRRAENIKKMLVGKGISESRIKAFGRGENNPIAPNSTKEGRAKNRRIEITIGK